MITRKRAILDKLGEVSRKIETILAGQDIELGEIESLRVPGETKLEKLQRFKAHLQATFERLRAGVAPTCERCGAAIPEAVLAEMPWALDCGCPEKRVS